MKCRLKMLCPKEVAAILGVSTGTLANWRVEGNFKFTYYKIGKAIRYEEKDVIAFLEARKKTK